MPGAAWLRFGEQAERERAADRGQEGHGTHVREPHVGDHNGVEYGDHGPGTRSRRKRMHDVASRLEQAGP